MSRDSATPTLTFATPTALPLAATFDGGRLTSDGGLPWLGEADAALGLCAALAACIPEWRTRAGQHTLETLVRQRVLQIACGYEDQDDADTLRHDPLLKLVCGRLPESGAALASQPTLARLENAVDRRACYQLAYALLAVYLRQREEVGRPSHLVLDLDSTDDPTHGAQEWTAYHGYDRQHLDHPLLLFDGDTGQLITAILRPGNVAASCGVVAVLKRLVPALRAQWPGVTIELRADGGFATPELYTSCEQQGLGYTIGLAANARLERLAAPLLAEAQQQQAASADPQTTTVRLAGAGQDQADSWDRERRVVYKAEALPDGPNPASWSPPAPTRPSRSTTGTWTAARWRAGSRISRTPAGPTASAATASWPTSAASSCTRRPTGCSTRCAAGWGGPASRGCNSTRCACGC